MAVEMRSSIIRQTEKAGRRKALAVNRAGVSAQEFGGHLRYLKEAETKTKRKRLDAEVAEYTKKKS